MTGVDGMNYYQSTGNYSFYDLLLRIK